MAELWMGSTNRYTQALVTANSQPGQYVNQNAFILAVTDWLADTQIDFKWAGEHARTSSSGTTYHYTVGIPNEQERLAFALRWA